MKPATLLALPALALAAATPAQVEERQLGGLNLACLTRILQRTSCFSLPPNPTDPLPVGSLIGLLTCPVEIITAVLGCALPLPIPVKN
ncbi:hypothetical protein CDV36_003837 [Fusarium kuroshium]|uniref:Hydrophobin n=1 Tax=Fusarium kuroshium TaxID=2010991 RepID=A0A3M2SG82_9HYPO|nr:hypothetical protein CDV36_003837 [Fusarium kuroshium]